MSFYTPLDTLMASPSFSDTAMVITPDPLPKSRRQSNRTLAFCNEYIENRIIYRQMDRDERKRATLAKSRRFARERTDLCRRAREAIQQARLDGEDEVERAERFRRARDAFRQARLGEEEDLEPRRKLLDVGPLIAMFKGLSLEPSREELAERRVCRMQEYLGKFIHKLQSEVQSFKLDENSKPVDYANVLKHRRTPPRLANVVQVSTDFTPISRVPSVTYKPKRFSPYHAGAERWVWNAYRHRYVLIEQVRVSADDTMLPEITDLTSGPSEVTIDLSKDEIEDVEILESIDSPCDENTRDFPVEFEIAEVLKDLPAPPIKSIGSPHHDGTAPAFIENIDFSSAENPPAEDTMALKYDNREPPRVSGLAIRSRGLNKENALPYTLENARRGKNRGTLNYCPYGVKIRHSEGISKSYFAGRRRGSKADASLIFGEPNADVEVAADIEDSADVTVNADEAANVQESAEDISAPAIDPEVVEAFIMSACNSAALSPTTLCGTEEEVEDHTLVDIPAVKSHDDDELADLFGKL